MKYNKAFTLAELLIALGIIGALAAIAIPGIMGNIQNRMAATKLKGIVQSIKQLADKQLVTSPTRDLSGTDFASESKLLTISNFNAVKVCNATKAAAGCWKTSATGADKVQYRTIKGSNANIAGSGYYSILLKNGAVLGYKLANNPYGSDTMIGEFCVDINGPEKPNMSGRDYFCFIVTQKGRIADIHTPEANYSFDKKLENCKNAVASNYCFGAIMESGWEMPY